MAPEQKPLFRTQSLFIDIAEGKAQDQHPYEPQNDFAIAVDNVLRPNVGQLYTPAFYEIQRLVHVFESLNPQLWFRRIAAK